MLNRQERLFRLLVALVLYVGSATEIVTGTMAVLGGVLGTVELATALMAYSPLIEIIDNIQIRAKSRNCHLKSVAKHS